MLPSTLGVLGVVKTVAMAGYTSALISDAYISTTETTTQKERE